MERRRRLSQVDFLSCSPHVDSSKHVLFHPRKGLEFLFISTLPTPSHACSSSRDGGYSLSMSLYFFLRMDTWSLKSTGSSLIWEWTRGMLPNQLANLFMQVWRWAKWSGSAQRDARELWGGERQKRSNKYIRNSTLCWAFSPPEKRIKKKNKSVSQTTYLPHHRLFVLFLLSDLYWW